MMVVVVGCLEDDDEQEVVHGIASGLLAGTVAEWEADDDTLVFKWEEGKEEAQAEAAVDNVGGRWRRGSKGEPTAKPEKSP